MHSVAALNRESKPDTGIRIMHSKGQRGFTLLELVLALAVILAISAVALPNLFDVMAQRQLVRGGDSLRVALVEARLEAMRTGRTQIFRGSIGGRQYLIQPFQSASDVSEAADMFGQGTSVMFGSGAAALPTLPPPESAPNVDENASSGVLVTSLQENMLPDEVLFEDVQVQATARSSTIQQQAGITAGDGWSAPILFYPDGTASSAIVTIAREGQGRVYIKLRGLTGDTDRSEVMP